MREKIAKETQDILVKGSFLNKCLSNLIRCLYLFYKADLFILFGFPNGGYSVTSFGKPSLIPTPTKLVPSCTSGGH